MSAMDGQEGTRWAGHREGLQRAWVSLDALSMGDALGEALMSGESPWEACRLRRLPPGAWSYTDDTIMAREIVRCLDRHARVEQEWLATAFAEAYRKDPLRGYGRVAHEILQAVGRGVSWKEAARAPYGGQGSLGNGGAMRAAPLGAYFAGDPVRVKQEAKASAEVTHGHPEGQAGAVAVALAASWMAVEGQRVKWPSHDMVGHVLEHLPASETRAAIVRVLETPWDLSPFEAGMQLGNGQRISAMDTVPFCLWCVSRHGNDLLEGIWCAVSAMGDMDTNGAIVGGIIGAHVGVEGIPEDWKVRRELLTD